MHVISSFVILAYNTSYTNNYNYFFIIVKFNVHGQCVSDSELAIRVQK